MAYLNNWVAANGTIANTLTSDSGATYTGGSGFKIQDNRLYCDNITVPLLLISQTFPATYELDLNIHALSLAGNAGIIAVCDGTYDDSFLIRASSTNIQMYNYTAGSPALVGEYAHGVTTGALPTIRVQVSPTKVALVINDVEEIAYTGITNSATLNRIAYRCNSATTSTTGFHVESLAEIDPDAGKNFVSYDNILLLPSNVARTIPDGSYTVTGRVIKSDATIATDTSSLTVGFGITHDAAMAHGTDFVVTANNPAVTPTDLNSTLTTGTVSLVPTVTGSSPTFTLTYDITRLDLQEGSYTWTQTIGAETDTTSSLAYTIDGNGTSEYYGTVAALTGAWAEPEYSALATGDNIYAVRTAGTGAPDVTVGAFPESTTWTIYIQDQTDDVWGSAGTLTVPAADTTAPVITLLGATPVTHAQQAVYTDAGATASDNLDGDITGSIVTVNPVDVNTVGSYTITYNVDDAAGNSAAQVTRTVNVTDQEAPTITLTGSATVNHAHGTTYTDAGATASDFNDGDVTADIVVSGDTVNTSTLGSYTILYDVDDAAGNSATQVSRTVNVTDQSLPVITLTGNATVNLTVGDTYTEQGATWTDNIDGSGSATASGSVNTAAADTYYIAYNFTDTAGNAATEVIRTVIVSAADVVPTQFDLGSDVTGAERSTATQRTFTIAGIDSGQTVSITATGSATVSPATGQLGDTVTVTLVSSGSFAATLSGGATINGISDSFSITTRAQIVPTVSTQPTNQSVTEGQTATFTAAFTNAASIQWYDASDDSAISGATGVSLAVNTVLADDANTYYAIATSSDSATVQTNTVTLSVAASTATQAPTITTTGGTSITLTVGDTYSDPAWTATDDIGSIAVVFTGTVDTSTAGTYTRNGSATNPIGSDIKIYTVTVEEASAVVERTPENRVEGIRAVISGIANAGEIGKAIRINFGTDISAATAELIAEPEIGDIKTFTATIPALDVIVDGLTLTANQYIEYITTKASDLDYAGRWRIKAKLTYSPTDVQQTFFEKIRVLP